jgi:hypothetical protein
VSDRQNEILNAIDATLSGYTDSDPVSSDAMRWSPAESSHNRTDERQVLRQQLADQAALYGQVTAIVRGGEIAEVLDGSRVEQHPDGSYTIHDESQYFDRTGQLYPHPPRRPTDRFSFTRPASSDSIPARLSPGEAMIPGPNGPIHIRGAYGDQPMQVTEVDLDDIEGERT